MAERTYAALLDTERPDKGTPDEASTGAPSWASRYPTIVAAYQRYLGRTPSEAEIRSQTGNGTFAPNDTRLQFSIQNIAQSPEATRYRQNGGSQTTTTQSGQWPEGVPQGDYQALIRHLTQGKPPTPSELVALEAKLKEYGINVERNAAGVAGKIRLPSGQIVDVIQGAMSGGSAWQWLTDGGGDEGSNPNAAAAASWWEQNKPNLGGGEGGGSFAPSAVGGGGGAEPGAYVDPTRPEWLTEEYKPGTFTGPEFAELEKDPGYQARLAAAQKGFERSAAARGSILSGGSQIALGRQQQNLAADEYQNLYGRRMGEFQTAETLRAGARGINENSYQNLVANKRGEYDTNYRSYRDRIGDQFRNEDNRYRSYRDSILDQFRLSEIGLNAALGGRY